jgi:hypothetical protein
MALKKDQGFSVYPIKEVKHSSYKCWKKFLIMQNSLNDNQVENYISKLTMILIYDSLILMKDLKQLVFNLRN